MTMLKDRLGTEKINLIVSYCRDIVAWVKSRRVDHEKSEFETLFGETGVSQERKLMLGSLTFRTSCDERIFLKF